MKSKHISEIPRRKSESALRNRAVSDPASGNASVAYGANGDGCNSHLEAALKDAASGLLVFPLHNPVRHGCSCGKRNCSRIGKHPRLPDGAKDATTDPTQIIRWWRQWPKANIGIATGPRSGLLVLDIDGIEGLRTYIRLVEEYGIPDTMRVETGRKLWSGQCAGWHDYFQWPKGKSISGSAGVLGPKVDVLADGDYVIAPPSVHANGERYRLIGPDLPVGKLPDAVIEKLFCSTQIVQPAPGLKKAETANGKTSVASVAYGGSKDKRPTLSSEALYGLAGDVVTTIEPHSEADPAAILIQFIVAVSNMIGPNIHCMVESSRHALNLFACVVGRTSKGRKGTAWGNVKRLCSKVDRNWTEHRISNGLSTAEGLMTELIDYRENPKDRRLLVVEEEFAALLRSLRRPGNKLSPVLRNAWDGNVLRSLVRKGRLEVFGAHVSLIGQITRDELLRYLSDVDKGNGFANRPLWLWVERSKCLPEGGRIPESEMAEIAERLSAVMAWSRRQGNHEMKRDEDARRLWADVYPTLSADRAGLLGDVTSRAEAQVLRLAAIYAVLDCSYQVRVQHLRAALNLWSYCFESAQYIFGGVVSRTLMDQIHEALKTSGTEGLSRTEIRDLFGRHESSRQIDQALSDLASMGRISSWEERTKGRTRTVWFAKG